MSENVPLQGKIFVARCHLLAALYLNVSGLCATCRIMETRESVQNFAPSPNNHVFLATYWAARRRAKARLRRIMPCTYTRNLLTAD